MNTIKRHYYWVSCVLTGLLVSALLISGLVLSTPTTNAEAQSNGTTVFRCIDINGVISFADAPCKHSRSKRLRIEHSLVQSAPISLAEQQRLHALELRLANNRAVRHSNSAVQHKRKLATQHAGKERCKQAKTGLEEIRSRKRRGYPVRQAARIDSEETALRGEIRTWCEE